MMNIVISVNLQRVDIVNVVYMSTMIEKCYLLTIRFNEKVKLTNLVSNITYFVQYVMMNLNSKKDNVWELNQNVVKVLMNKTECVFQMIAGTDLVSALILQKCKNVVPQNLKKYVQINVTIAIINKKKSVFLVQRVTLIVRVPLQDVHLKSTLIVLITTLVEVAVNVSIKAQQFCVIVVEMVLIGQKTKKMIQELVKIVIMVIVLFNVVMKILINVLALTKNYIERGKTAHLIIQSVNVVKILQIVKNVQWISKILIAINLPDKGV